VLQNRWELARVIFVFGEETKVAFVAWLQANGLGKVKEFGQILVFLQVQGIKDWPQYSPVWNAQTLFATPYRVFVRCHNITVQSSMRRIWIHIVVCFHWTIKHVFHVKKLRIVLHVAFFGIELELLFETTSGCHTALFSTASAGNKSSVSSTALTGSTYLFWSFSCTRLQGDLQYT
jgi:hypothetical protein